MSFDDERTVSHCYAKKLVYRPVSVEEYAQSDHNEWQPRRAKGEDTQETEQGIWMSPAPNVDESAAQGGAQEGLVKERCKAQEGRRCISHHPGKVCERRRGLFQHP